MIDISGIIHHIKLKHYNYLVLITLCCLLVFSCENWEETADVSHVSTYPEINILGGDFLSYIVADSGEFEDPGAEAYEDGEELDVYWYGEVDLTTVGVYIIYYYTENSDDLYSVVRRIVSVTYEDVSANDLSGDYTGTLWEETEMTVTKEDEKGLYECTEILGYPLSEMEGSFVDLGDNTLVLLPGEGDFGSYASAEGEYTLSTLSWTVYLQDDPYSNISLSVTWQKVIDDE